MNQVDLQGTVLRVLDRAQREGSVTVGDIRAELDEACLDPANWQEVLKLAGASLEPRQDRYYYVSAGSSRLRQRVRQEHKLHDDLHRLLGGLIDQYQQVPIPVERRERPRIELVRPIQVQTDDGRLLNLLSCDLSLSGIRLLSTAPLDKQKVRVAIPHPSIASRSHCFAVHILWSVQVGDDLYENGGLFQEILPSEPEFAEPVNQSVS